MLVRAQLVSTKQSLMASGFAGLAAAVLVGAGEFMLHFDEQARYFGGNEFFSGVPESRATFGHFFGVLGAPVYVMGAWHLRQMLEPASRLWSAVLFYVMAYGCIVGAVWIGSRATAAYLVNSVDPAALPASWALYELRYENLLTVTRLAVLVVSGIFVWLILTGRTRYPRWVAVLNPILLILASFAVFWLAPAIGKYMMPIALNVAFFVLFAVSLVIASSSNEESTPS